ncbi:hypothetical protein MRB53_039779 [Persea americana]|nr:hypothetical protein MRB53_039779 [Persea americana]
MYHDDCPFCTIARDNAHQIWRNNLTPTHVDDSPILFSHEDFFVVLDQMPLTKAHLLLITRNHYATIGDIPGSTAASIARFLPILSRAVARVIGIKDCNIIQNNGERASQNNTALSCALHTSSI